MLYALAAAKVYLHSNLHFMNREKLFHNRENCVRKLSKDSRSMININTFKVLCCREYLNIFPEKELRLPANDI